MNESNGLDLPEWAEDPTAPIKPEEVNAGQGPRAAERGGRPGAAGGQADPDTVASVALSEAQRPMPIPPPERAGMLIHPGSGEALDPRTASIEELAGWLDAVRDWENAAKVAKRIANREFHRRMDAGAKWTLHEGGFKVSGESPTRFEWDVDALIEVLDELEQKDLITENAVDEAIESKIVHTPRAGALNNLLKVGGEVKEAIEACRVPKPPEDRRVSLSREGGSS